MTMNINTLHGTIILQNIKYKLMGNQNDKSIRYWVAGYFLNKNNTIIKISPTFGFLSPRKFICDNDNISEVLLKIIDIKSNEDICNILEYQEISWPEKDKQIYISDSEEDITKVYNDLVYETRTKLNKMVKKYNDELNKTEYDFYKSDVIMETLLH